MCRFKLSSRTTTAVRGPWVSRLSTWSMTASREIFPRLPLSIKGGKTRRCGAEHPGIPSRVSDIVFG